MMVARLTRFWIRGWMKLAGPGPLGRLATRFATWFAPRFFKRVWLADLNPRGYVAPSAEIDHSDLRLGANIFIGERVKIVEDWDGGYVDLAERVVLHSDLIVQTGQGGTVSIGPRSSMHRGCQLLAYKSSIRIGSDVHIGPNCSFFPYNHSFEPGELIVAQPLISRGGITLEDDVNLGCGVIVLDGVTIGKGAVIGAGSVVVQDVPSGAIAMGVPARVLRMRSDSIGIISERTVPDRLGNVVDSHR